MKITRDITCSTCPHLDHSGAFTPGGAKDICGHPSAGRIFYPQGPKQYVKDSRKSCDTHNNWPASKGKSEKARRERGAALDAELMRLFPPYGWPAHWKYRVVDLDKEPPEQCPLRHGEPI